MTGSTKTIVRDNFLLADETRIPVGSQSWFEWLSTARRFSFKSQKGNFVAQCEKRRNKAYWYAYRRAGKLHKVYLGKTEELTLERLERASFSLTGQKLLEQLPDQPVELEKIKVESRIDTSLLPLTKFNVPILPRQPIPRPRLTRRINTPLTLICAPSGFGKSTLLNDWKQTCGHPVAWLSLDDGDNHFLRFWHSISHALQTIDPELGMKFSTYLDTASLIQTSELVSHLTNDIVGHHASYPRLGLVLDDFHRINRAEIYDSLQAWLEQLPPNMKIVILGQTNPPLSLGHLRARGLVTELDANDLRFTLEEGVDYLRHYQREISLPYDDLAKLVRHTEGWAAGLTLTALALAKQEDHRQFIETFSGAHIYIREYFMETVLQRSSPEVQAFLFKTAILKQMTGSLCEAVTGQGGGAEMLSRLWQENLFIVRLEEQGWYRYHDLFAEMLLSQLQTRFPEEMPHLHRRAAQWYRTRYASADAIYHLLAIEAWEEAALLMEEMALRELEQYGEDSRLLRWLQELPASVVQKHKTLLFIYLRLAHVALPKHKIELFIDQVEANLEHRPPRQLTQDEHDVLVEIQRIRHIWEMGEPLILPERYGTENDAKWELLAGMHLLGQTLGLQTDTLEDQITDLYHRALTQRNLFVILMAGGSLARRIFLNGQLRRSEKIARQVLEQAFAMRGKLPEPASIALATLSQIYMERNEPGLAQKYLDQAIDVDPNPTSTNMPVQIAIQRIELQIMQGNFTEALANGKSVRQLHLQRPSGLWTDQDLLAYEAFIHIRMGDVLSAEQILGEAGMEDHNLSQLVRAEISLARKQADAAERQLVTIISQYPYGVLSVPLLRARILLARALFDQHKISQALQAMKEVVRLAAPEQFYRPFLERSTMCPPLLSLALQSENLTGEARLFIKELLRLTNPIGADSGYAQIAIDALAASASISPREQEVLRLINTGYSNREIAGSLSISESTVKTHIGNIYYKLNVNSRVQAVMRAKELKLI